LAKQNAGHLFQRLCDIHELGNAWSDVLRHYRKGREPQELRKFQDEKDGRLEQLSRELRSRRFIPSPAALVYIPKPGKPGERREISLVVPEDRIVLTALNRLLTPAFERQFSERSYAYRRGRGAFSAIEHVTRLLREGRQQIAAADIDDFFGNIRRDQLLDLIRKTVWEQNIIDLLETYLHIGSASGALDWTDSGLGVAQGSPLSPLLSNVYLHPFDQFLGQLPGVHAVRYADNFILLSQEVRLAASGLEKAEVFLLESCGMKVNAGSRIHACANDKGFEFLGFQFQGGRRTMTVDRLNRKKQAMSELFRMHKGSLERLIEELSESAKGWRQYYGAVTDTAEQLSMLEQHVFDVFVPWLQGYRQAKKLRAGELKSLLLEVELPSTKDQRQKVKWVDLLLARSKPVEAEPAKGSRISEQAKKAIERRRREIRKKKDELQEIVISKPGAYLGRTGERLLIRRDG
jgi:RNA-directed DNA polymerase